MLSIKPFIQSRVGSSKCDKSTSNDENAEILDKAIGDDEIYILSIEVESEGIKTANLQT